MNKLFLVLPLFAGVSWAGTTYYSGAQTENAYNRLLDQVNSKSSEMFVVKSAEYNAGFMKSTAITEVFNPDNMESGPMVRLQHVINHSPVSVAPDNARFGAANIVTTLITDDIDDSDFDEFLDVFENREPFVMTTDVAIDGATSSNFVLNAFDLEEDEKKMKSSGLVANFVTTSAGSVSGDLLAEDFMIHDSEDENGELKNFSAEFNFAKLDETDPNTKIFFDIKMATKLEEGTFNSTGNDPSVRIKDAHYNYDQNLSADDPYVKFSMGIDALESQEVPLNSMSAESTLSGFSVKEMIANYDFYKDLPTMDNPEEIMFSPKSIEILRATFIPDTSLNTSLKVNTTDGDVDADINIWFAGNGSEDGYTGMQTIGDLAKAIAGTATANADRSALNATPLGMMLDEPMAQIYLTVTEDTVTLNAELEELLLRLNQQVLPLEMMAGEMLNMPLEMIPQMM